jgi:hypothetical protein
MMMAMEEQENMEFMQIILGFFFNGTVNHSTLLPFRMMTGRAGFVVVPVCCEWGVHAF